MRVVVRSTNVSAPEGMLLQVTTPRKRHHHRWSHSHLDLCLSGYSQRMNDQLLQDVRRVLPTVRSEIRSNSHRVSWIQAICIESMTYSDTPRFRNRIATAVALCSMGIGGIRVGDSTLECTFPNKVRFTVSRKQGEWSLSRVRTYAGT